MRRTGPTPASVAVPGGPTDDALIERTRAGRAGARDRSRSDEAEPAGSQVDAADAVALRMVVGLAVDALPRPMREAVVLRFYCGFAEHEIAVALRVPVGTVKSRLGRARTLLAEAL